MNTGHVRSTQDALARVYRVDMSFGGDVCYVSQEPTGVRLGFPVALRTVSGGLAGPVLGRVGAQ